MCVGKKLQCPPFDLLLGGSSRINNDAGMLEAESHWKVVSAELL